ncbi:uncharacterized protein MAM_00879 [Metarhizium album ARSEF 1941]|uniref:Complex 1 LYR protein n=1 Tax=Metarhizium album (strain ARSEF 1941) TaxID=1081103 RepID=A0A0B2X7Z7_METAS|nr:uncharacterized protein MAM_00879 [Metarhizium album ARSEF 1941]KHO01878.1 hypothetical protein MAM_00879 [Metarhizium album ARSEF 1941]
MASQVIHAYRHLYRGLLRAVQYSSPARYIARDQLRAAFAEARALDAEGVKRTLWFLEAARRERGLEHSVLKNLLRVRGERARDVRSWRALLHRRTQKDGMREDSATALEHYDMTVAMLNRSMGLCLR